MDLGYGCCRACLKAVQGEVLQRRCERLRGARLDLDRSQARGAESQRGDVDAELGEGIRLQRGDNRPMVVEVVPRPAVDGAAVSKAAGCRAMATLTG